MPRPTMLPVLDWRSIFENGATFDEWLAAAENSEHKARMRESSESLHLEPAREAFLRQLPRVVHVVAIAEDWCGDVVRFAPVLMRVSSASQGNVQVRFITRAQRPDVFVRFLTNGGEAIPKFVFLSDRFTECGNWGPMPAECRRILSRGKGADDVKAARERVARIYESDPDCEAAVREFLELADIAACSRP